jgi:hypothetical protein
MQQHVTYVFDQALDVRITCPITTLVAILHGQA